MIGWLPQEGRADPNRGLYVLENPSPAQLQVFEAANYPYQTEPYFAPPELMKETGAERYIHFRDSPAVIEWLGRGRDEESEDEPPILLSTISNMGGYVLRNPTKEQCKIFKDAGFPYRLMALGGMPPDLMKKAGATFHKDVNKSLEYMGLIFSLPSDEWNYQRHMNTAILGHPMTGGIWVLEKPSRQQIEALKDGGYDFWSYDMDDQYHGLLEKVGAKFYEDPEEVRHIIDTVSPGGPGDVKEGERGGRVKQAT
jgi:hypothetical protein